MNLLQTTAVTGADACRHCMQMFENIVSFFGGKIDAVVGKMAAIGAEMARLKPQTRRRHGAQYADAKVDAVREAMVRHEESSVARNSENTRRTLRGVFEYARPLLESAGIATLEQFRKIKHALDVRAYRNRLKELEARESRKEESDSCVEEGVSCDCAREETSAAAPGGCVAPRRNEEGRGAVHPKATFHSPLSHAPDYLILREYCECPSRSDGPPLCVPAAPLPIGVPSLGLLRLCFAKLLASLVGQPDAFISPGRQAVREADVLDIMGTILFQAVPGLRRGIVL